MLGSMLESILRAYIRAYMAASIPSCAIRRIVESTLRSVPENISNKPSFHQEHPGVSDSPDGSDGTSYPLTENQTRPLAQTTGRVAGLPWGSYYTMPVILVALNITLAAPASGFLYFASGIW